MEPKVTAIGAVPDPKAATAQTELANKIPKVSDLVEARKAEREKANRSPEREPGPDAAETRLVIEMDKASGSYVYKTINRQTGEVMSQLPRAEVLKLRDGGNYAAGAVIRTKV